MSTKLKTDLLAKQKMVEGYVKQAQGVLSAFSFVSIFTWQDFFDFEFKVVDENLCIFAQNEIGCFQYLPPLGRNISPQAIEQCFAHMKKINGKSKVTRIENVTETQLKYFPHERFDFYKKANEYFYFKKDLIELKGNDYKSK